MGRKVTQDNIEEWMELREKGYSFRKIGEQTGWNLETVRKYVREEEEARMGEEKTELEEMPEADLELESRAFSEFEDGKTQIDLVKEKICSADKARELGEKYADLQNRSLPKIVELDERTKELTRLLDSFCATNLNKDWECPECGTRGMVAIHYKCTSCGHDSWWGYHPK